MKKAIWVERLVVCGVLCSMCTATAFAQGVNSKVHGVLRVAAPAAAAPAKAPKAPKVVTPKPPKVVVPDVPAVVVPATPDVAVPEVPAAVRQNRGGR